MIIIVEGVDRVGKTTLCNALSNTLNIPIYKHSQRFMNYSDMDNINETDKMLHLLDLCSLVNADVIFDRFHFSDYAYGIIERHYNEEDATRNLLMLDSVLARMNAIMILMKPTDINSSSVQHGKDLTPYLELMEKAHSISSTLIYTCDYSHIDNMVKEIKELLYEKSRI